MVAYFCLYICMFVNMFVCMFVCLWTRYRSQFCTDRFQTCTVDGKPKVPEAYCLGSTSAKGQGQNRAKGQIHLTVYNFASNCHRDFKFGSYLSL